MYGLGIDLGGMTIKAGIVSKSGSILYKESVDTLVDRDNNLIIESIRDLIFSVINNSDFDISDISHIGIGTPGTVDTKNGVVVSAYNLGFEDVYLKKCLEKDINLPIFIDNDANCAVIAEYYAGASKNFDSAFLITIGTGIGGGYIVDGETKSGAYFSGGEFGHMVIHTNGRECTCGRLGCFESYCSATALIKEMQKRVGQEKESVLYKLVDGNLDKLDPIILFEAKEKKCALAKSILDEYNVYFSDALANFINIFEPEIILIGGGISKQGENLLKDIRELTYKKCFNKNSKVKIEIAHFHNDAGIIGASFLGNK